MVVIRIISIAAAAAAAAVGVGRCRCIVWMKITFMLGASLLLMWRPLCQMISCLPPFWSTITHLWSIYTVFRKKHPLTFSSMSDVWILTKIAVNIPKER